MRIWAAGMGRGRYGADGDLRPSDAEDLEGAEPDDAFERPDLESLDSEYVRTFSNRTTFEYSLTRSSNLPKLAAAAERLGATRTAEVIREGKRRLDANELDRAGRRALGSNLKRRVLNVAIAIGGHGIHVVGVAQRDLMHRWNVALLSATWQ